MKTRIAIATGLTIACATVLHAQVVIDSLEGNGQLTVTAPSNSDITVEWASSLASSPEWRNSWIDLNGIPCTNGTMAVEVPMFYRVTCWTNGLLARAPIGRTYTYGLTNAYGQGWTEEFSRIGQATIPAMTNNYEIMNSSQHWSGSMPSGAEPEPEVYLVRLTDTSLFALEPSYLVELEIWRMDDVGISWTNFDEVTTIEAYETVSVPAGTFTNCIRLHQRDVGATETNSGQRVWIKPGLIEVKSIFYADWTDPPEAAPVVSQLQSWSDG